MRSVTVDVSFEERYWYPEDGGVVWLAGYQLVDAATGSYLARDAPAVAQAELLVTGVAGAGVHHAEALGSSEADPGRPLTLRRDPANEHDPHAIAVDLTGGEQLGWVPREVAAELAPEVDAGTAWSALALRESRSSPRDPRKGLTMLLARSQAIELDVRER